MIEQWRDIPWPVGKYRISNRGRVYSIRTQRLLKLQKLPKGYLFVRIGLPNDKRNFYVHRLVVQAFLGIPSGLEVNHKDLNKSNNNLVNLEVVTHAANQVHAALFGVFRKSIRLTEEQVTQIKQRLLLERQCDLALEYKVSRSTICDINKGRIWLWV